jgi:LemA protein
MSESPNNRIPDEIAEEVLALASQYYADYQDSYSTDDLIDIGGQVQIPAELVQKAIADIEAQKRQERKEALEKRHQARLFRNIGLGVAGLVLVFSIGSYNRLVGARSQVQAAWAQVENQQQRRADLIPDLINLTQALAKREENIINQLTQAQASYTAANTPQAKAAAIEEINTAIQSFTAYSAQNPELGSNQLFINLQYELAGTANRLAVERKRYNEAVIQYNQTINGFPLAIVAKLTGFQEEPSLGSSNPQN